jgi:hypothetical protein
LDLKPSNTPRPALDVKSAHTRFKLEVPHEHEEAEEDAWHRTRVINPVVPGETEKAQISVEEGDDLYREIRIENVVTDENGKKARLKAGADVDVVIEADSNATTKKPD